MAISPKILEEEYIKECKFYEKQIDEQLEKQVIKKGSIVRILAPNFMTEEHFSVIKNNYINAGWSSILWHQEQPKENNYITLKY